MPKITINGRPLEVAEGTTILQAARGLGIEIPALCHLEGIEPRTSCFVCVVKVKGRENFLPSCATRAIEGMEIETDSPEVIEARRTALELLLSDHVGDCEAPCRLTCPAHMDIPLMNRLIAEGRFEEAHRVVKRDIALPAVLGRICPAPCEKACRRKEKDAAVSICLLKRFVADVDLHNPEPFLPEKRAETGKKVAVVGSGPAGLSAAYYTLLNGHACTVFDENEEPGGKLRYAVPLEDLPRGVLDAEIELIRKLGAEFELRTRVGENPSLEDLRSRFDAVFIAAGQLPREESGKFGLPVSKRGLSVESGTYRTAEEGVFAGGGVVSPGRMAIRALAHGKEAAFAIDRYLRGREVTGPPRRFNSRIGKLREGEIERFMPEGAPAGRLEPGEGRETGFSAEEAPAEALRCLHCDCRKPDACKLREYAGKYGASQARFKGDRRLFEQYRQHSGVVYEPGKCIACGICVKITEEAREPLGLTFIGRGFSVRVGVPFGEEIQMGLTVTAARCVESCPTGALAFLESPERGGVKKEHDGIKKKPGEKKPGEKEEEGRRTAE